MHKWCALRVEILCKRLLINELNTLKPTSQACKHDKDVVVDLWHGVGEGGMDVVVRIASGLPAAVDLGGPVEAKPYLHRHPALKQL